MQLRVGTSGFSYKEWKGSFYPEDLPAKEMLGFYARRLPAVEINNTFYRLPRRDVLLGWRDQVPDDFRFVLKASRRITHFKRLAGAEEETRYLLETAAALETRLGPVLFQLPPNLKCDVERLETFLAGLPEGTRAALEFRHASWDDPAVHAALASHGAALVAADTDEAPVERLEPTTDWGYLRLRRSAYDDGQLEAWLERLAATGWGEVYVFFKHEDAGAGPALAARLAQLAGA